MVSKLTFLFTPANDTDSSDNSHCHHGNDQYQCSNNSAYTRDKHIHFLSLHIRKVNLPISFELVFPPLVSVAVVTGTVTGIYEKERQMFSYNQQSHAMTCFSHIKFLEACGWSKWVA